ncbi:developmental pluripotency-associated protein 4 isoform X2 [Heterocephalus glaber]|uniref:Developmental pluripotency-associated protein 4 isoform X2 n=1 Tax=Heterocephalus glaber TaxID=10181 RepID=A0AAX6QYS3_HETGA|nr:developmental pluripotency-associated protein 4 isoform X2 [Heterocephalus glaber]
MENARGKEGADPGRSGEEHGVDREPGTSSAKGIKRRKRVENDKEEKAQDGEARAPRKKIQIPPLPQELPPVTLIHRDILRAWCQQLKISTKGQKLEAYKRLCESAYPQQKPHLQNIPITSKEARVKSSGKQRQRSLEGPKGRMSAVGTDLPEGALIPAGQLATLQEPPALYEEVSTSMMTTAAPESVLASWGRIAAGASRRETVQPPTEAYGDKWCVVHGCSLPADMGGWVQLQFHAGQAWVPEKKGRVNALFLLPSGTFPPPHLEDNLLCPTCVRRNKVLVKSLRWD